MLDASVEFGVLITHANINVKLWRGEHPEFIFAYRGGRVGTMNNMAWQWARREIGIPDLHIHDLRHTVRMRLREAEVREETIADLLWHVRPGMTAHYSVAPVAELVDALNRITDERSRTNRSLATIAREACRRKVLVIAGRTTGYSSVG